MTKKELKTVEDLKELSKQADELADSNKMNECFALLQQGFEAAKNINEAYVFYFESEIANYNEDYSKALELIKQAIAIEPKEYLFLYTQGCNLGLLNRLDDSIECFDKALEIKPDDYNSLHSKGVSFSRIGQEEKAIEYYNKALEIKPDDYHSLRGKGVSFSEMGQEEKAIEYYDQALEIKPDDYHSLRNKGVSFSSIGQEEKAIEYYNKALEIKPDDYHSLREKGVYLSKMGQEEKAIEYFNKALEIKPDDYHSLRNKGVYLSKMGQEEKAIEYFNKALEIKPDDYHSLREKGVSFSEMGQEEKAIEYYDQALEIKPDDYHSLRNKGVSFSKMGQEEKAIKYFNKALEIKPDDYHSLREKGVYLSKMAQEEEAIKYFNKALKIKPDDYNSLRGKGVSYFYLKKYREALQFMNEACKLRPNNESLASDLSYIKTVAKKFGFKEEIQSNKQACAVPEKSKNVGELKALVEMARDRFKNDIDDFKHEMKDTENQISGYIQATPPLDENRSLFFVLRKWNSYTPILSGIDGEDSVGGGYFLYHKGEGVVVDPGYNFIENFHRAGLRIADIKHIVITHAHNDHTVDFESLLSLFYQFNRHKKSEKHQINIYLNASSMTKLNSLLELKNAYHKIHPIAPNQNYSLSDELVMKILPAYHSDTIATGYAVGLHFEIGKSKTTDFRSIVLTSDTSLLPSKKIKDENGNTKEAVDSTAKEVWEMYNLEGQPDVLIPHIGSVRTEEFDLDIKTKYEELFYPNHLGVMGTLRVITALRPQLAVISEFGEELKDFRPKLINLLEEVVTEHSADNNCSEINVLPGDLPFVYDIATRSVYCIFTKDFIPVSEVTYTEIDDETFTYFSKSLKDGKNNRKIKKATKEFIQHCTKQTTCYFK